jgi:hypothetical protein
MEKMEIRAERKSATGKTEINQYHSPAGGWQDQRKQAAGLAAASPRSR